MLQKRLPEAAADQSDLGAKQQEGQKRKKEETVKQNPEGRPRTSVQLDTGLTERTPAVVILTRLPEAEAASQRYTIGRLTIDRIVIWKKIRLLIVKVPGTSTSTFWYMWAVFCIRISFSRLL